MRYKLYRLIHSEKSYRRYYYQPLDSNHPNRLGVWFEIKSLFLRYAKAVHLPFNKKRNMCQYPEIAVMEDGVVVGRVWGGG